MINSMTRTLVNQQLGKMFLKLVFVAFAWTENRLG